MDGGLLFCLKTGTCFADPLTPIPVRFKVSSRPELGGVLEAECRLPGEGLKTHHLCVPLSAKPVVWGALSFHLHSGQKGRFSGAGADLEGEVQS